MIFDTENILNPRRGYPVSETFALIQMAFCFQITFCKQICILITKTYLYNFDPFKPNLYIEKNLGLQGYTLFFLFLLKT